MSNAADFSYVRTVDFSAKNDGKPFKQVLIDHESGAQHCAVRYQSSPPGDASDRELHSHDFEQQFYVVSGEMSGEIDGKEFTAPAGSLVVIPAGHVHRQWNSGVEDASIIEISAPVPDPKKPRRILTS